MDGLKRYVNDDRFRVDGDKNMRLLAFAFTIVFVWTGPKTRASTNMNSLGAALHFWYGNSSSMDCLMV